MITQEQVQQLQLSFKRVFTLPMSKMTLREVQNAIGTNFPNQQDLSKSRYSKGYLEAMHVAGDIAQGSIRVVVAPTNFSQQGEGSI